MILIKILVRISSEAIHKTIVMKSEVLERIFIKDFS